jgi:hypothetical protein
MAMPITVSNNSQGKDQHALTVKECRPTKRDDDAKSSKQEPHTKSLAVHKLPKRRQRLVECEMVVEQESHQAQQKNQKDETPRKSQDHEWIPSSLLGTDCRVRVERV